MKISYYELLGMIKEGNIPNEVLVTLQNGLKPVKYFAEFDYVDDSLTCYSICNEEEVDENYHDYLTDCFIEMSVFDKCIEIIEEEKEISKITKEEFERLDKRTLLELIVKNQNELIDEIKKLKENI